MRPLLLVIDVHYLCHRAFHTTRDLEWKGRATGVIFGFLKSLGYLRDEFLTERMAFCFEHPHLLRRDFYPPYKKKRRAAAKTLDEMKAYAGLQEQIAQLRKTYLPRIGFKNVFCYDGYESDDIMAALALNHPDNEMATLITGDSDMLQVLRPNVEIYSPQSKRITDEGTFFQTFLIPPPKWAVVKAIAGCKTDEVEGIAGVGDVGALKYVQGKLPVRTLQYQAITSEQGKAIVRRNRVLVQLPYAGCPVPELQEDDISKEGWRDVCGMLGLRSIAGLPFGARAYDTKQGKPV